MWHKLDPRPDAGDFRGGRVAWDLLHLVGGARHRPAPDGIDLTDTPNLRPYAIACLAALGCLHQRQVSLVPPTNHECRDHLARLGLFDWFTAIESIPTTSPRSTNLRIEHLDHSTGSVADAMVGLLERECEGFAPGLLPRFADHLDEVMLNAITHACSPVGCFVAGQAFPKAGLVELAVVDLGQTVRGHLSQHPSYQGVKTDVRANVLATEEGVTGTVQLNRFGEPNSGTGLASLRSFCEQGGGEFAIISGDAVVWFGPGSPTPAVRRMYQRFEGCLINLRLFFDRSLPEDSGPPIIQW